MTETVAEEIARLQREIAQRQQRLFYLVAGDQRQRISVPTELHAGDVVEVKVSCE